MEMTLTELLKRQKSECLATKKSIKIRYILKIPRYCRFDKPWYARAGGSARGDLKALD